MISFDFKEDYELDNDRVKLMPLKLEYLEALYVPAKNASIWTFFDSNCSDIKDFENYISEALGYRKTHQQYPFVIFDKATQEVAGMTRMYDFNPVLKNVKLGHTWIGLKYQGSGLNRALKHCILEFLFEKLDVQRVGFGVHEENTKSIKALIGIGATEEGVLRSFLHQIGDDGRCDLILFSILKEEWDSNLKYSIEY